MIISIIRYRRVPNWRVRSNLHQHSRLLHMRLSFRISANWRRLYRQATNIDSFFFMYLDQKKFDCRVSTQTLTSARTVVRVMEYVETRSGPTNVCVPKVSSQILTTGVSILTSVWAILARASASILRDRIRALASLDINQETTARALVSSQSNLDKTNDHHIIILLDVDECLNNPCPVECINSPGSYSCLCPFGYHFEDNICKGMA